ncbi:hypothetical protein [Flavobacterium sp.]|uniref:hypothetical protein n=1 Tax=Flavobacterium sp. TaxID=239 RepID=UPI00375203A2
MSLNKSVLELAIVAVFTAEQSNTSNPNQAVQNIASGLADAIDLYIKTGVVNVNVNTTVITAGGPTAQTGTGVGTGVGTIS